MEEITDVEEWERVWSLMEHRRIVELSFPKSTMDFEKEFGELLSATTAKAPSQYVHRLYFTTEECPICSSPTLDKLRIAGTLFPVFQNMKGLAFSVWLHPRCFNSLPICEDPTPFPW